MQDKTEDTAGASPKTMDVELAIDRPRAHAGLKKLVAELLAALDQARDEKTHEAIARELELASAREKLSKLTGLHPDRALADHLDALATRPGHEEVRRERAELRATLVEALGPLPTDHPHMLGQLRVKLAKALSYRDRCPVTAEDVEAAGVTREHVRDWMTAQGWAQLVTDGSGWESWVDESTGGDEIDLIHACHSDIPWLAVRYAADHFGRPAFDILDEMAAQEAP